MYIDTTWCTQKQLWVGREHSSVTFVSCQQDLLTPENCVVSVYNVNGLAGLALQLKLQHEL